MAGRAPAGGLVDRLLRVERLAALVEVRHPHRPAADDGASLGRKLSEQDAEEGGLPRSVRPDDADPVTGLNEERDVPEHLAARPAERDVACLEHGLAQPRGLGHLQLGDARPSEA